LSRERTSIALPLTSAIGQERTLSSLFLCPLLSCDVGGKFKNETALGMISLGPRLEST
jgi:hypothetical protein